MCKHYTSKLKRSHRHYIKSKIDGNCVLCLAERNGSMTYKEIAKYLNLSVATVRKIESEATNKIEENCKKALD